MAIKKFGPCPASWLAAISRRQRLFKRTSGIAVIVSACGVDSSRDFEDADTACCPWHTVPFTVFAMQAISCPRLLLVLTAIAAGIFTTGCAVPAQSASGAAQKRPNIIFIFSDDHASRAISAYGSKINKTPHIDRIANEGMRFDHCLVTNSICGPSRAVILTGKYSHKNGFFRNGNRLTVGR